MTSLTETKALIRNLCLALSAWEKLEKKKCDVSEGYKLAIEIQQMKNELNSIPERLELLVDGFKK